MTGGRVTRVVTRVIVGPLAIVGVVVILTRVYRTIIRSLAVVLIVLGVPIIILAILGATLLNIASTNAGGDIWRSRGVVVCTSGPSGSLRSPRSH